MLLLGISILYLYICAFGRCLSVSSDFNSTHRADKRNNNYYFGYSSIWRQDAAHRFSSAASSAAPLQSSPTSTPATTLTTGTSDRHHHLSSAAKLSDFSPPPPPLPPAPSPAPVLPTVGDRSASNSRSLSKFFLHYSNQQEKSTQQAKNSTVTPPRSESKADHHSQLNSLPELEGLVASLQSESGDEEAAHGRPLSAEQAVPLRPDYAVLSDSDGDTNSRNDADDDSSSSSSSNNNNNNSNNNNSVQQGAELAIVVEKLRTHKNNHQQSTAAGEAASVIFGAASGAQNSRHYGAYLASNPAPSALHLPPGSGGVGHFAPGAGNGAGGALKYNPSVFGNNINLNYIHSLLGSSAKPAAGGPLHSRPAPSSAVYGYNLQQQQSHSPQQPAASGTGAGPFSPYYYSAQSPVFGALTASLSNLHSQQQQQQHQLHHHPAPPATKPPYLASLQGSLLLHQPVSSFGDLLNNGSQSSSSSSSSSSSTATLLSASSPFSYQLNSIEGSFGGQLTPIACGRQQLSAREPRIVGGNTTYEGEFPWAVSIQRHGNHHCGGVIVGRRWILTAAHCVRSQLVANLVVRTGGSTLSRSPNSHNSHLEQDYLVDQIVMHDDFSRYDNLTASQMKSSANTNNADIALLKLKQDIHWNELAWPVCFPEREAGNFSGHDAIVVGWGKLNEKSEEFSNELQKVKLTIIDNKVCQNWFRQAGREMPIDDRIICAGFKNGGKDACHGDSGGPLLSKMNGHYVVVGVVSTGIGCARPLLPGLYSRVSSYINWIERYVTLD